VFDGTCDVDLRILEPTPFIVVHNLQLSTRLIALSSLDLGSVPVFDRAEYRPQEEYSVFYFANDIAPGQYRLSLGFNATLSRSMEGFYSSRYTAPDGTDRFLATTQFEPTYARKAFPCLDEPGMKAVFEISIAVERGYHALSNMPVNNTKQVGGLTEYNFNPTLTMSSYLVAFVVSDFESISTRTKNGINVSVYTKPSMTYLGKYALAAAAAMLDYYQTAYGIEFPLPKCDLIAIPDFQAGAMENWGLITFRDTALLYDPQSSTETSKERVAEVVAHELAHQWFGNLVTMKWWNDLWLNEGFAEFMEYKAVNAYEPNWKMLETFIPYDLVRALHADESAYTHSIALPVNNPNEINNIFDDISYGKGSSVLRLAS
jgi:aminopeptidase N